MFQGCTGIDRIWLYLEKRPPDSYWLESAGPNHVSCGDLSKSFTVPNLRPYETDDLFLLQIASAILVRDLLTCRPGPLGKRCAILLSYRPTQ